MLKMMLDFNLEVCQTYRPASHGTDVLFEFRKSITCNTLTYLIGYLRFRISDRLLMFVNSPVWIW